MDPLHPNLREALKRAHPGLTDRDIDRYEELLAARFELDPELEADEIQALDRERERLLEERIPRYQEVWAAYVAERLGARPR